MDSVWKYRDAQNRTLLTYKIIDDFLDTTEISKILISSRVQNVRDATSDALEFEIKRERYYTREYLYALAKVKVLRRKIA